MSLDFFVTYITVIFTTVAIASFDFAQDVKKARNLKVLLATIVATRQTGF